MTPRRPAPLALAVLLVLAAACGGTEADPVDIYDPYAGVPPKGSAILPAEAEAITGATDWTWVPFADSLCNDATIVDGAYEFTQSSTGLAISWGTGSELVVFLQGGGACWDFITCGGLYPLSAVFPIPPEDLAPTATTGPFGPTEFADTYTAYPNSWVHRSNLPDALANATIVFVPYCTGDIHGGDRVTTYTAAPELAGYDLPQVTWKHAGHANIMAFLKRLGSTFPNPSKLVVAGSSAGGFGALANYPAFKWYWPDAKSYLIDDSAPPLIGNAIPSATRADWYSSWDLGVSLDAFCTGCRADMSEGISELAARYPEDRIALVSHLEDWVIRSFFGEYSITAGLTPMSAPAFETALRALGTDVMDPANAKYFFTDSEFPTDHPALNDPTVITTPDPGFTPWLDLMLTDDAGWVSVADPAL